MAKNDTLVEGIDPAQMPEGTGTTTIGTTVQGTEGAAVREEVVAEVAPGITLIRR